MRDSRFRPDYLKIYPALVVEGTELYQQYLRGEYQPLGDDAAAELVSQIKELLPKYVRLQRVQRDIPAHQIAAGVKKSNLRQLAEARLKARGGRCHCIRCREAGLRRVTEADVELKHEEYLACGALEHFFSFEDEDETLVGFLRLRLGAASAGAGAARLRANGSFGQQKGGLAASRLRGEAFRGGRGAGGGARL